MKSNTTSQIKPMDVIARAYDVTSEIVSELTELKEINLVAGLKYDDWNITPVSVYGDIGPFLVIPATNAMKRTAKTLLMPEPNIAQKIVCETLVLDPKSGRKTDAFLGAWKRKLIRMYKLATPKNLQVTAEDDYEVGGMSKVIEPLIIWCKAYNLRDLSTTKFGPQYSVGKDADATCDEHSLLNYKGAEQVWNDALWEIHDHLVHVRRMLDASAVVTEIDSMFTQYSY